MFTDLVVRNYGATAAIDVKLTVDPAPRRTAGGDEVVVLPSKLPTSVPGQEWRTFWDSGHTRHESDLPTLSRVVVEFRDATGTGHLCEYDLDFAPLFARDVMVVRTQHDLAEAAREVAKVLKGARATGGALKVLTRDGDAYDRRAREVSAERRSRANGERAARRFVRRHLRRFKR